MDIEYLIKKPARNISNFVERFWMLSNHSGKSRSVVVIPDGRIDVFFSCSSGQPFRAILLGLESKATEITLPPEIISFGISFKLPAIEYLFDTSISNLLNKAQLLPPGFWGIEKGDLDNFDRFCKKITHTIQELGRQERDERKEKLFDLIYSSKGIFTVKELSEQVFWSSRQINRYFNLKFGISLKAYCKILRFRASFQQIKEGNLFPELNFSDQAHFINQVKKLSGATPKELYKNKNDRFLQFSSLSGE